MTILTDDHPICKREGCNELVCYGLYGRLLRYCSEHRQKQKPRPQPKIDNSTTPVNTRTLGKFTGDKFIRQFDRVVKELF